METAAPIENLAQVATRWQDTMLSLEKEYEQEPEVLKIGEVAIGTLGNFSASTMLSVSGSVPLRPLFPEDHDLPRAGSKQWEPPDSHIYI